MPKLSAVKPLGYTSINGRSLGVLAALRAYGLLEGRGDDVRVSDDAITILNAPHNSSERCDAMRRAFETPPAFAILRTKDGASADTLRWHLIKANFRDDAADKLVKVFLDSRDLVNAECGEYDPANPIDGTGESTDIHEPIESKADSLPNTQKWNGERTVDVTIQDQQGMYIGNHERVLQSGMLSKKATYRVIVSGHVGEREIERLIKKLEMDKEILADPDDGETSGDDLMDVLR
jgi:hypothetical protein